MKRFAYILLIWVTFAATAGQHNHLPVATPWPAQTTIITMLGYGDNIVGTSAVAQRIPLLRASLPRITSVPVISINSGHELNPEQIITLAPRLLFISSGMIVPKQQSLEAAGIHILAYEANSMAALRRRVMLTAEALGPDAVDKARAYEQYFQHNQALVARRLKDLPAAQRVRVYHSMGNPLTTSGRPSLNQDWMDLAGANNVAEHWFTGRKNSIGEVQIEQVVVANPQVIVAMNKRDADEIRNSSAWSGVDAVARHRVVVNPQGMFWWSRETSEQALQFLWLAKTLYPQRFADIDMSKETRDFYQRFFGISLTDEQIKDILNPNH